MKERTKTQSSKGGLRRSPRKLPTSPRKVPRASPFKAPKNIPSPSKKVNAKSTLLKRSGSSASARPKVNELKKYASTSTLKAKTTEDLELERIQEMKRLNAKKLREHQVGEFVSS